ncbi:MAG: hypothetical protein KC635_17905 [Myxococcales bacterium]|nr:hypothetical protein [Myxococcales bacterium]MCB9735734.1 hypothetical protein [Deltaproteobacteria bacterium]
MKHLTLTLAAALGLTLLGAGAASAAEISQIQLQNAVLDGDGLPVTTKTAGDAYTYTLNYSITGADLSGVAVTISVDLPEGLWVYEENAPESFASNCHQAGSNQWKFDCTFTAADLDINTAGGIAGQARLLVRSRRYFLNHGDQLTVTANMVASYTNTAGEATQATASGSHTMAFTATPAVQTAVAFNTSTQGYHYYRMMAGPAGEPGVGMTFTVTSANIGTAPLSDVVVTNTLPTGFLIAGFTGSGYSLDEPLWSSGTIHFRKASLGNWTSVNATGGIASPTSQNSIIAITAWAPCDVLATTRAADGSVPEGMRDMVSVSAVGTGFDANGVVGTYTVGDESPNNNAASSPNLTGWTCGTGQAYFHKWNGSDNIEPGSSVSWTIKASPPISSTFTRDAVVWDELDPSMTRFSSAIIDSPDDDGATFTIYYCDLTGEDTNPATMRGDFLGQWKDDPSYCTTVAPADGATWALYTHLFFYAETWGIPNPQPKDFAPELSVRVGTVTSPDASHGDLFQNTAWYEAENVNQRSRTDSGAISDQSHPTIYTPNNIISVSGSNPPFAAPGEQLTFNIYPYRSGSVLPRNPTLTTTLPPGLIYKSSSVTWGSRCVTAEADGTVAAGSYIATDHTAQPTVALQGDGSLTLDWSFGSAAHPFRLRGQCPGTTSGVDQLLVKITVEVDPNGIYTNNQQLVTTFVEHADNEIPGLNDVDSYAIRVQVPGEMRVEVVPWCEQLGRIGFNSVYENSGGVDLTNVAVVFPMPETVDPGGAPYDVTRFAGATFADTTATIEYQVGGSWTAALPTNLANIQAVRLLIPSLPANSGPQGFFVDITVPSTNPGDSRIHATAAMQADQLTDAASPVSIPFVVNTCPRALVVTKFFDADGDGARDAGEPVLKGWRFDVRDAEGTLIDSRTTNAAGQVSFTLIQGTYTVTETLPTAADGEPVWSATTAGGATQTVAIGLNQPSYALTFGNTCACDDGDPCTTDTCDPVQGCLFNPRTCDDGNACTADSCDPTVGCVNAPTDSGTACNDGSACTIGEACDGAGHCLAESTVACDPVGPCVARSTCNDDTGACDVVYKAEGTACEGDNACQRFACDGQGACVASAPVSCDDGNVCTNDTCDPVAGCKNAPVEAGVACDDENACTLADSCDGLGHCGGAAVECNDNGLCQEPGTCDPASGQCVYEDTPCYLANFWTAVADANGRVLGSVKCGFDASGEPFCDTNADGSLKIYPEVQCVAPAGTASLPASDDGRAEAPRADAEPSSSGATPRGELP